MGLIDTIMIRPMKTKSERKKHSAAFKAKVGMDAILGVKTEAQIARDYSIHHVLSEDSSDLISCGFPIIVVQLPAPA